jgi:hypothetical protein
LEFQLPVEISPTDMQNAVSAGVMHEYCQEHNVELQDLTPMELESLSVGYRLTRGDFSGCLFDLNEEAMSNSEAPIIGETFPSGDYDCVLIHVETGRISGNGVLSISGGFKV